ERDSMPGPKVKVAATGFPSRSSTSAGQNHAEIPGPVAMACQTSSGVPGTSTSTWMERRPEGSFCTLMLSPWDQMFCVRLCLTCTSHELAPIVWLRHAEPEPIKANETLNRFANNLGRNCRRARAEESLDNRGAVPRIISRLHLLAQHCRHLPRVEITSEI